MIRHDVTQAVAQKGVRVKTPEIWSLWLDGARDLVQCWDTPPSSVGLMQWNNQRTAIARNSIHTRQFFGATEPEARKVLLEGWPAGGKIVTDLAAKIEKQVPPPKSRRRVRKWGEDGDECSYERIQAGHDNVWQSTHRRLRSACGLIELVAPWGSSCGATLEELKWNGAAALAVTDLLERADFAVELCLVTSLGGESELSIVRIDLKAMGELANVEQLAAVAIYPPAYRLFGLCSFQLGPHNSGSAYNGHPHCEATRMYPEDNKPHRMWNYRPNVMTVVMRYSDTMSQAIEHAADAITNIHKMVDPEYNPELEALNK